ncbi:MAG: hypothetical protein BWK79_07155 [Beggiatoa sp. IS2]|nr:MAG: hypothetical protein BWK79_07155 [Beggiatoa sp. IS2]
MRTGDIVIPRQPCPGNPFLLVTERTLDGNVKAGNGPYMATFAQQELQRIGRVNLGEKYGTPERLLCACFIQTKEHDVRADVVVYPTDNTLNIQNKAFLLFLQSLNQT